MGYDTLLGTTVVSARSLVFRSSFSSVAVASSVSLSPSISVEPHRDAVAEPTPEVGTWGQPLKVQLADVTGVPFDDGTSGPRNDPHVHVRTRTGSQSRLGTQRS